MGQRYVKKQSPAESVRRRKPTTSHSRPSRIAATTNPTSPAMLHQACAMWPISQSSGAHGSASSKNQSPMESVRQWNEARRHAIPAKSNCRNDQPGKPSHAPSSMCLWANCPTSPFISDNARPSFQGRAASKGGGDLTIINKNQPPTPSIILMENGIRMRHYRLRVEEGGCTTVSG